MAIIELKLIIQPKKKWQYFHSKMKINNNKNDGHKLGIKEEE